MKHFSPIPFKTRCSTMLNLADDGIILEKVSVQHFHYWKTIETTHNLVLIQFYLEEVQLTVVCSCSGTDRRHEGAIRRSI